MFVKRAATSLLCPDEARFGVAASTTSTLLIVFGGCNIALQAYKYTIKVGADREEGHSIKAMLSLSMVAVLQRGISPDEARFGVAASTTSTLLIVVGGCNIALQAYKYTIKVGADSEEGHSIKAMLSLSMIAVLQRSISPDEARYGVAASNRTYYCYRHMGWVSNSFHHVKEMLTIRSAKLSSDVIFEMNGTLFKKYQMV